VAANTGGYYVSTRGGLSLDSLAPLLEERSEDADEEMLELTAA
jgi:hypothetical protein